MLEQGLPSGAERRHRVGALLTVLSRMKEVLPRSYPVSTASKLSRVSCLQAARGIAAPTCSISKCWSATELMPVSAVRAANTRM